MIRNIQKRRVHLPINRVSLYGCKIWSLIFTEAFKNYKYQKQCTYKKIQTKIIEQVKDLYYVTRTRRSTQNSLPR
jgi:hypothetical protein